MSRRTKRNLIIIVIVALVIRVAAALYLGNTVSGLSGAQDEISYSTLGQRFATGHGLTFPEPWYPWIKANAPQSYYSATMSLYLAAVYTVFGYQPLAARLTTAILSTLIVGVIFLLARRLFDDDVAVLAGIIAAFYVYLIFYGVTLVTETPFILGLVTAIYLAYGIGESPTTWRWIALGVTLTVTVLFRMAVIFFVPFLLGWIVIRQRQQWVKALIPVIVLVLAILPFTVHNYLLWGRFMLLESQFGHVFWNGNHPGHEGNFHPYRVFPIPDEVLASNNDAEITNRLLRMGIENVVHNPWHFVRLIITRLREFFVFWPTADSSVLANLMRVFSFAIMLPFIVIGLVLSRRRWQDLAPIWLFMLIHTGVYALTWTMIRYRIPMDTLLVIFAALAVVSIWRYFRRFQPSRYSQVKDKH